MTFSTFGDARIILPQPGNLLFFELTGCWTQIKFIICAENWLWDDEEWYYSLIDMIAIHDNEGIAVFDTEFTLGPHEGWLYEYVITWGDEP